MLWASGGKAAETLGAFRYETEMPIHLLALRASKCNHQKTPAMNDRGFLMVLDRQDAYPT